jgi:hypothetical protein
MAEANDPLCVRDRAQLPDSWRPSAELQKTLSPAPWSRREAKDAQDAITSALEEMIGHFERKPSAVQNLWDDSIESLIQVTYASANEPELDAKARDAARHNLTALITPYLDRDPESATCAEFQALLPLANFAHRLYPAGDIRTDVATERTNAAYRACGSLEAATGIDVHEILADNARPEDREDLEDLFDLHLWSLWLIEAELYPDIELPAEARAFGPKAWKYFETYRLAGAREFEEGARDEKFAKIADLATHIAHIPTGVHRFPLYVEDKPGLYRYHRENFYPVLQSDRPDLLASFVDSLRQYGCTAENDVQVRDGTRFLLEVFHDSDDRWMDYRRGGETNSSLDDYALIHRPWTAVLGLRERRPEPPGAGTYGGLVRSWLPHPHQRN